MTGTSDPPFNCCAGEAGGDGGGGLTFLNRGLSRSDIFPLEGEKADINPRGIFGKLGNPCIIQGFNGAPPDIITGGSSTDLYRGPEGTSGDTGRA